MEFPEFTLDVYHIVALLLGIVVGLWRETPKNRKVVKSALNRSQKYVRDADLRLKKMKEQRDMVTKRMRE